jgi:hypothetical protein
MWERTAMLRPSMTDVMMYAFATLSVTITLATLLALRIS